MTGGRELTDAHWRGTVVRVLGARSGSGAVRVRWDRTGETSVVSNPSLNMEKV